MKYPVTLLAAATLAFAAASHAQNYPVKPVRIVVGFAPGGSTDLTARIFAQELNKVWNLQVVVDNRPGASGMIGAELASKAAPDGYSWLVSPQTSIVVAPLIFKKVNYNPIRDFAPIAVIGSTPQLLAIHPSLPARNFKEFAAFVRVNAKNLSYASGGFGSTPHMAGELLNTSLNVRVTHVPYKGENPGVADLLGGQIPYMFSNFPVVLPHVRAGSCGQLPSRARSARRSHRSSRPSRNPASPASIPRRGADSTFPRPRRAKSCSACMPISTKYRLHRSSESACWRRA